MKYYMIGLMAISMITVSCKKENAPAPDFSDKLIKIGQQNLSNRNTVALYAVDTLSTGFNELSIKITKNNAPVSSSAVSIATLMDMGTMKHSSPSVAPVYNSQHKLYEAAAVFTMASESGGWSLKVTVDGEELTFILNVKESKTKLVTTPTATNGHVDVLSLFPRKVTKWASKIFLNHFQKRKSDDLHTHAMGLSTEFYEMTSMGHSSPNNVDPVDSGTAFNGKVNFTMSGDWRFISKSFRRTVLFDDVYLDIVF